MRVILTGPPMCGKSHFGKRVAERLRVVFIDTDQLIEQSHAMPCREIALQHGLSVFRKMEKEVILNLAVEENAIIAIGGGSLQDPENALHLKQMGIFIYLDTPIEILLERLKAKNKVPSILNAQDPAVSLKALVEERRKNYELYADHKIETASLSEEMIIKKICALGGQNGQQ